MCHLSRKSNLAPGSIYTCILNQSRMGRWKKELSINVCTGLVHRLLNSALWPAGILRTSAEQMVGQRPGLLGPPACVSPKLFSMPTGWLFLCPVWWRPADMDLQLVRSNTRIDWLCTFPPLTWLYNTSLSPRDKTTAAAITRNLKIYLLLKVSLPYNPKTIWLNSGWVPMWSLPLEYHFCSIAK
jgi:hypothetical protein